MAFITSFEVGSITILCKSIDKKEVGTTLNTYASLTSSFADSDTQFKPSVTNWTFLGKQSVIEDSKPDNAQNATVLRLRTPGRTIDAGRSFAFGHGDPAEEGWGLSLVFPGELRYTRLYWKWAEDVLDRFEDRLKKRSLYDAVYASLFLYDHRSSVVKAFCDIWCPLTNTAHTSKGEMSISLLDLIILSGLPSFGEVLDEVVPTIEELRDSNSADGIRQCKYLLFAYHELARRNPGFPVKMLDWVSFWFKGAKKYETPTSKSQRDLPEEGSQPAYPLGRIDPHADLAAEIRTIANSLGIPEVDHDKVYLAGFLSAWLCKFVLPRKDPTIIRPEVFKAASMLASGVSVCLSMPVLASIYSAMDAISMDQNVLTKMPVFPSHFLYAWLAAHFGTHNNSNLKASPLMVQFSGHLQSKPFSDEEAKHLLDSPDLTHMSRFVPSDFRKYQPPALNERTN